MAASISTAEVIVALSCAEATATPPTAAATAVALVAPHIHSRLRDLARGVVGGEDRALCNGTENLRIAWERYGSSDLRRAARLGTLRKNRGLNTSGQQNKGTANLAQRTYIHLVMRLALESTGHPPLGTGQRHQGPGLEG
ncbi:hypothetical protein [Actinoplanes sp. NPDC049118]|uniref:hypothetical protein n=1 Tax=Actinoplanes sp. NPDC049118 TaxID=3155769 RepID=UPI0033C1F89B